MLDDISFLRYLIDLIDTRVKENSPSLNQPSMPQASGSTPSSTTAPVIVTPPPANVTVNVSVDGKGNATSSPQSEIETPMEREVFVPPLQAKIEMMKKMSGIEDNNQELLNTAEEDEPFEG